MFFTLVVFITWCVLFSAIASTGYVFCSFLKIDSRNVDVFSSFWVGFVLLFAYLQIWNIFFPVGLMAFASFLCFGLLLFSSKKRIIASSFFSNVSSKFFIVSLLIVLFIANRSVGHCANPDSPVYHIPAVVWLSELPLVKGWANIIPHFGFNSSYFLYVALFEIFEHQSHHFAAGLLLAVLLVQCVYAAKKIRTCGSTVSIENVFYLFCFPVILNEAFMSNIASPSPDLPIFILTFVLTGSLLSLMSSHTVQRKKLVCMRIVFLCVAGITIKLSFVFLAVLFIACALYVSRKCSYIHDRQFFFRIALVSIFVIGLWLYRGIITSGFFFFPSAFFSVPVEWRVPTDTVINISNWVRSWARQPSKHFTLVLGSWDWFVPWCNSLFSRIQFIIPLILSVLSLLKLCIDRLYFNSKILKSSYFLVLMPLIGNVIFWFFTAPDIRFINASFWSVALSLCAIAFGRHIVQSKSIVIYLIIAFLVIIFVRQERYALRSLLKGDLAAARDGFVPILLFERSDVPYPNLSEFKTQSGLTLYVPGNDRQIWYSPIPATPFPNKAIRLRESGKMGSGFIVDNGTSKEQIL